MNVYSILLGAPILVMIFGHFFLNDKVTVIRCMSAIGLAIGILLIAKPDNFTSMSAEVHYLVNYI
jgi:drug/metabolite transporter (DMT)-like permease